jgi:hypothetical protein
VPEFSNLGVRVSEEDHADNEAREHLRISGNAADPTDGRGPTCDFGQ